MRSEALTRLNKSQIRSDLLKAIRRQILGAALFAIGVCLFAALVAIDPINLIVEHNLQSDPLDY